MRNIITALMICTAAPVLAQDRMSADDCAHSWDAVLDMTGLPNANAPIKVDPTGWCVIEGGAFDVAARSRLHMETLRWRASDIARFVEDGLPPRSIEVVGDGIHVLPLTGDRVYDYLFRMQSAHTDLGFGLIARWDGVQNAVFIDESYVDFGEGNRVDLTARIDGTDFTDSASIQTSLGTMGLQSLAVKSTFDGWFERYLALPIGVGLLSDATMSPEAQVAALQQEAIVFASSLPTEILPTVAQEALAAFITELPTPRGTLQLQLNADPVIGAARMMPLALTATDEDMAQVVARVLEGVRLLVTWSPIRE